VFRSGFYVFSEGRLFNKPAVDSFAVVGNKFPAIIEYFPVPFSPSFFSSVSVYLGGSAFLVICNLINCFLFPALLAELFINSFIKSLEDDHIFLGLLLEGPLGQGAVE
jgi:hypothetical protein